MRYFGIYNKDGKITMTGKTYRDTVSFTEEITYVSSIKKVYPKTQYVKAGSLLDRPENKARINKTHILDDGIDEIIISDIPNKSEITVSSFMGEKIVEICDDGILKMSSIFADTFTIKIESFPERNIEFTVVAG